MMTATWGGGANSPVAATGNLDDFGKVALALTL
jgi:hypothetical protein